MTKGCFFDRIILLLQHIPEFPVYDFIQKGGENRLCETLATDLT